MNYSRATFNKILNKSHVFQKKQQLCANVLKGVPQQLSWGTF